MQYYKNIQLRDGRDLLLRNGTEADAEAVLENFITTHAETDFLLSYPEENTKTLEWEAQFLKDQEMSENSIEIIALLDGQVVGTAGINPFGSRYKVAHRAELGISVLKACWGMGIGRFLTEACIECARNAGYEQLELDVVAENDRAIALYKKVGFCEFGRNPKGFRSKVSGHQEVVMMRMEL